MKENVIVFSSDSEQIKYFAIQDKYDKSVRNFLLEKDIKALLISPHHGFKLQDVSFLSELDFIETINFMFVDNIKNISALNNLHNLRHLYLDIPLKSKIDFDNFPSLEDCGIEWSKNIVNIHNSRNLKKLRLFKYKKSNLQRIDEISSLEELLFSEGSLESIEGIENLKNLKSLSLYCLRKLKDISSLKNNDILEHFDVTSCKNLNNYLEVLWSISNLKSLGVSNMPRFDSLNGIQKLKHLERLVINERTKIIDGETKYLLELSKLQYLVLQTYKSYSITGWNIEEKLGIKNC